MSPSTLMFQAIKPLGLLLARLPVGPGHPGVTAGANFQLPYRARFLLPRLDELAIFAVSLEATDGADVLAAVSESLSQCAAGLMAHVEMA